MDTIKTIGVILLNLGGPDSLDAIRPFLYNLFSDRQIMKLGPSLLQKPLAWLISTLRSRKTEGMYRLIGGKSPILEITKAQAASLEKALNTPSAAGSQESTVRAEDMSKDSGGRLPTADSGRPSFKVYIGMRYWHPFIENTVRTMHDDGISEVVGLSLYPHYSLATSGSSFSALEDAVKAFPMSIATIPSWFDHPLYIDALTDLIVKARERLGSAGAGADILFSAHSLPLSIVESGDPYVSHIMGTIDAVAKKMPARWHLSYQSKSGPVKWLRPATEEKIRELAEKGVKELLVVPISFVSDHIETLYEIDILYKRLAEGLGIRLVRADSLNVHPLFIRALSDMVLKRAREAGWSP
ncbi:MAG TPA: ferrochelatase [Thermodesulfovibrionales bacterium]|nr:ferrochelatase [Thermodesulfovibrionales bacterium]